jgi:hypothetical protein
MMIIIAPPIIVLSVALIGISLLDGGLLPAGEGFGIGRKGRAEQAGSEDSCTSKN